MKTYRNRNDGEVSFNEILATINEYVKEMPDYDYEVAVGTDSVRKTNEVEFVSVITARRIGRGGRFWWDRKRKSLFRGRRDSMNQDAMLRERMQAEAMDSVEIAREIKRSAREGLIDLDDVNFAVHVDISDDDEAKTSDMVGEIAGMVRGFGAKHGFETEVKPDAYSAQFIADRKCS